MAKQNNDPLGILSDKQKQNNDPLGIKKKVSPQPQQGSTSGLVPSTGGSQPSQTEQAIKSLTKGSLGFGKEVATPQQSFSGGFVGKSAPTAEQILKPKQVKAPVVSAGDKSFYQNELKSLTDQMNLELESAGDNEKFRQQVLKQYEPQIKKLEAQISESETGKQIVKAVTPQVTKKQELVRPENVPQESEELKVMQKYGVTPTDPFGIKRQPEINIIDGKPVVTTQQDQLIPQTGNLKEYFKEINQAKEKDKANEFASIDFDEVARVTPGISKNQLDYLKSKQEEARSTGKYDEKEVSEFIETSSKYQAELYEAGINNETMADFTYRKKKETAEDIFETLPEGTQQFSREMFKLNSEARDLLSSYFPKGVKINPETGMPNLDGLSEQDRSYIEKKMGEYNSRRKKLLDETYFTINDNIIAKKNALSTYEKQLKVFEQKVANIDNPDLKRQYEKQLNEFKLNADKMRDEIDQLQQSKTSFFNPKPSDVGQFTKFSNSAQQIFYALPKDMSAKDKFDFFYRQLYNKTKDMKEKGDFDADYLDGIGQNVRDWLDIDGYSFAKLSDAEKEYLANKKMLQSLAPIYFNNATGITEESAGFINSFWNGMSGMINKNTNLKNRSQTTIASEQLQNIQKLGFSAKDLTAGKEQQKDLEQRASNIPWYSAETLGEALGTTAAIMTDMAVGGAVLKVAKGPKAIKAIVNAYDKATDGTLYGKYLKEAVEQGVKFEVSGNIIQSAEDELNFVSGFAGTLGGELLGTVFKKAGAEQLTKYISGVFGKSSDRAAEVLKRAGEINARGIAEVGEETTQELVSIYNDELRSRGFWEEVQQRYGTFNDVMKLVATSYIMGSAFGLTSSTNETKSLEESLTPEQQQAVQSVVSEVSSDVADGAEAIVREADNIEQTEKAITETEQLKPTETQPSAEETPAETSGVGSKVQTVKMPDGSYQTRIVQYTDEVPKGVIDFNELSDEEKAQLKPTQTTKAQQETTSTQNEVESKKVGIKKEDIGVSIAGTRQGFEEFSKTDNFEGKHKDSRSRFLDNNHKNEKGELITYGEDNFLVDDRGDKSTIYYQIESYDNFQRPGNITFAIQVPKNSNIEEVKSSIKEIVDSKIENKTASNKISDNTFSEIQSEIITKLSEEKQAEQKLSQSELDSKIKDLEQKRDSSTSERVKDIFQKQIDKLNQQQITKTQENVNQENITGLPSDQQVGETAIEAKPIEATSTEQVEAGGNVQALEEKVVTKTQQNEVQQTETETEEIVLPGENQKRRDEGRYTKDGVEYVRNEPNPGVRGKEGDVRFTESTKEKYTYKLVEADELQPSHQNGQRNPNHFIPEAQPKSRTDAGSIVAEQSFANNPRFESLGQDQDAYSGAPIVNERNEVIQGNNRSAGLKKGYKQGSVQYKQDLANNAEQFGFTKEQVEGMNNPVLVREIKVDDDRAIELGNYDVKDMETGGKSRIDATTLSRRIPLSARQQLTDVLFQDDNISLNESIRKNQNKVIELLRKYLNQAQRTSLVKDGLLTKNSISDIEELVKQFLFDGADTQLSEVFENLPKTVQEGVRKSMPYIFGVDFNKSILKDLQNGLIALNQFVSSGIKDFAEWKNQQDMFNDGKTPSEMFSPLAVAIAEKLNSSKQSEIVEYFKKYASETKGTEADMFNEAIEGKTKEQATKDIFGESSTEVKQGAVKQAPKKEAPKPKPSEEEKVDKKAIDKAISFLDDLESKLDEFGKETLGINIPVALLKTAVQVAKTSLKAGKAFTEAVNDAIQHIKDSDFYKKLSDADKKSVENNVSDVFGGKKKFEDIVEKEKPKESKPTEKTEGGKKYRFQSQDWRAAQMSDEETKKEILEIAKYEVQNEKEMSQYIDDMIDLLGEEGAIQEVVILPDTDPRKVNLITEAGARMVQQSRIDMDKALESNDTEAYEKAKFRHEQGLKWIHSMATIRRKGGQINAYARKTYEKYPSVFLMEKQKEFDDSNLQMQQVIATYTDKDGKVVRVTVQDAIDQTRESIQNQISGIVDQNITDDKVEKLLKENEELKKRLAQKQSQRQAQSQKDNERVVKAKQNIKSAIEKFKNASKGGQTSVSLFGLNSEQIEAIGEIIKSYIELGYATTAKVVNATFSDLKDYFPSLTKDQVRSVGRQVQEFESMYGKEQHEKEVKAVKEGKVITAEMVRALVKMHFMGQLPYARTLAETLVAKLGLSEQEAKQMADSLESMIMAKVKVAVEAEMTRFAEKGNEPTLEELRKKRREGTITLEEEDELYRRIEQAKNQREVNKILKLVRLGKLSDNNDFARAFERKFGFRSIPTDIKKQLDSIVERIFTLEQDAQREVEKQLKDGTTQKYQINATHRTQIAMLQKEYNTLLETQRKVTYARVLKEMVSALYVNMLSGTLTFIRAFIGGYGSGALGTATYILSNVHKPKSLFRGLVAGIEAMPSAYSRAIQSRKKGYDFFGESSLKGDYNADTMGWYERTLLSGLGEAYNNKEWLKVGYKSVGQLLKVIHALGALDTFMNTVSGAVVGTTEADKANQLYDKTLDADFKDIAQQEWDDLRNTIQKQVQTEVAEGKISSNIDIDEEVTRRIKKELGITGSRLKAKKTYITNRVQELKENALGGFFEQGVNLAKDASLMGTPDGFVGLIVKSIKPGLDIKDDDDATTATLKFLLNGLFKFVRITGQLANKTFNNIPVLGVANAFIGPGFNHNTGEFDKNIIKGKLRSNPLLVKQRIVNNILVTSTVLALWLMMFDDDEEEGWILDENRPIDVRGFGTGGQGGKYKNERTYEDFQNLSISFTKDENGKWTNYVSVKLIPEIAAIVATLASYSDYLKGDVDDRTKSYMKANPIKGTIFKALGDNAKILTESSFSSVGRIFKNIQQEENFFDGLGVAGRQLVIDNTKPLVNPTVFQSITKEITKGKPEKEAKGWEFFVKNLYGLDSYLNDNKTDVFGNEYKIESDYSKFMREMFGAGTKRSEENKKTVGLLYKFDKGANVSKKLFNEMLSTAPKGFVVSGRSIFGKYSDKYQSNDDKLAVEAQDIQEKYFREQVLENYEYLNSLETKEELEKALKELQTESVQYAKEEIVNKYEGTKKLTKVEE